LLLEAISVFHLWVERAYQSVNLHYSFLRGLFWLFQPLSARSGRLFTNECHWRIFRLGNINELHFGGLGLLPFFRTDSCVLTDGCCGLLVLALLIGLDRELLAHVQICNPRGVIGLEGHHIPDQVLLRMSWLFTLGLGLD
jgi:hypothetical protein